MCLHFARGQNDRINITRLWRHKSRRRLRVLWLTRGFPEEKLLWSDSWAQDCKLQGQDSRNESMCVSFLIRKRIRESSGLIWTVFDSVRIRFHPHYRAVLLGKAAAFECRVNICNFCHCWISSTSSNYRNSRLKIEIKKVFNIWPQNYCYMHLSTIT